MNQQDKELLERFALDHKVILEEEGQVGMGRPCVGFTKGTSYIAYNPINMVTFETLSAFGDDRIRDCAPENAYDKSDHLAVLVHDDNYEGALQELVGWVRDLNEIGVEVLQYQTGATGVQAMLSGHTGHAVRPK